MPELYTDDSRELPIEDMVGDSDPYLIDPETQSAQSNEASEVRRTEMEEVLGWDIYGDWVDTMGDEDFFIRVATKLRRENENSRSNSNHR
jgi:hypothetical protein